MIEFAKLPFWASFFAGLATFFSPCVLPLIPVYITFITGASLDQIKSGVKPLRQTFWSAVFFVLGFSLVFILMGASATYLGGLLGQKKELFRWLGGLAIIVLGVHLTGVFRLRFLEREKRLQMGNISFGYLGSFFVGLAFAVGWTPCVGPILASVLILASNQQTVYQGMFLLTLYSLGLGIPLLVTALFINWALRLFSRVRRFYPVIEIGSGLLLILVGGLLITNNLNKLVGFLSNFFS
ncbi:MAG: cytochrome c biogenesis protein CcdA [Elusimicrobiota bacterium]